MNRFVTTALFATFCLVAAGCTSRKTSEYHDNPMPKIWASIQGQIDGLKKAEATQKQWTKCATEGAAPISTLEELHKAIAATGVPADPQERQRQQEHLDKLFRTSHHTIHFGFECDHHAIVYFDSTGRQLYVHP